MADPKPTKQERRMQPRRTPRGPVEVVCRRGVMGLGPNLAVSLLDVSQTGARLLVREPLKPGEDVELEIGAAFQARLTRLPGTVAWCVATADGKHCAGVRFQRYLNYADLSRLS